MAAVSLTSDGKPHRIALRRVENFSKTAIAGLARAALEAGAHVLSDGFRSFPAVTEAGCAHTPVKTGSGAKAAKNPRFKWVNTLLGNIKAAMVGTYRAVRAKRAPDTSPNSNTASTADTGSKSSSTGSPMSRSGQLLCRTNC